MELHTQTNKKIHIIKEAYLFLQKLSFIFMFLTWQDHKLVLKKRLTEVRDFYV